MIRVVMVFFLCFHLAVGMASSANDQGALREIIVNIPAFRLYLYENGVPIRSYPIGIGNTLKPSQLGKTKIINRVVDPTYYPIRWWERGLEPIPPGPDNPVGTRWLGLSFQSYGIHGTNNPASIGKAMSSGCIRMYNEDVEELTDLVVINTPVELIYRTILLSIDPLTGTRQITVLPDIYNLGTNTLEAVRGYLEEWGWTDAHLPALQRIVARADGSPHPLPVQVALKVNGEESHVPAVSLGKQYYIPLRSVQALLRQESNYSRVQRWDDIYVELQELVEINGLGALFDDGIDLFRVHLYFGETEVDVPVFVHDDTLLLPVDQLSKALHIPVVSAVEEAAFSFRGIRVVDLEECSRWGFTVDWKYAQRKAFLQLPQVYLEDVLLGFALKSGEGFLIPINKLRDFDLTFEWLADEQILLFDGTYGIEGYAVNGTIFVPDWVIDWLLPGAELRFIYPQ